MLGSDIHIIATSIRSFEEICDQTGGRPDLASLECRKQYRVPLSHAAGRSDFGSIGLGVLVHTLTISCANANEAGQRLIDLNMRGQVLDAINRYQLLNLKEAACSGDLIVRAWCPKEYRRCGHIDGPLVVGSDTAVERVGKFIEFFRRDFTYLLLALFLALIFSSFLISRFSGLPQKEEMFFRFGLLWFPFLLVVSGASSILVPIETSGFFWARLSNGLAILAFSGCVIARATSKARAESFLHRAGTFLLSSISSWVPVPKLVIPVLYFCVSNQFAKSYGLLFLAMSLTSVGVSVRVKDAILFLLGISAVSDSLKLLDFYFLPTAYLHVLFTLGTLALYVRARLESAAAYFSKVRWAQRYVAKLPEVPQLEDILAALMNQSELGKISVAVPEKSGACRIIQGSKVEVGTQQSSLFEWKQFLESSVPPVIAHVMTTNEAIWHVDEQSDFARLLRKGEPQKYLYRGRYFSALPLRNDSGVFGVVAITDYPKRYISNALESEALKAVLAILLGPITERLVRTEAKEATNWASKVLSFKGRDKATLKKLDWPVLFPSLAAEMADSLGCRVALFSLDVYSRKLNLLGSAGYSSSERAAFDQAPLYAVRGNEQGPVALAANRNRAISVQNVAWVTGVLHPSSVDLLRALGTNSFCVAPIHVGAKGASDPYGIIWLDSCVSGFFKSLHEEDVFRLGLDVGELIVGKEDYIRHEADQNLLKRMLPKDVAAALASGTPLEQVSEGFLVMCDLRDSTLISRKLGAAAWTGFVDSLTERLRVPAEIAGASLKSVVWDAFYFTLESDRSPSGLERVERLLADLIQSISESYPKEFVEVRGAGGVSPARFCVVYGDTSMGLSGKVNARWTFTGTAMAEVSKLEQVAKKVPGDVFSVGLDDLQNEERWNRTDVVVPGVRSVLRVLRIKLSSEAIFSADKRERRSA
jgi:hypothetical protein